MNEYANNPSEHPQEQTQPGPQAQSETPPPQPDPIVKDLQAFIAQVQQRHEQLRELSQRDDIPGEVAEALRRLADRPLVDSLTASVDHAISQPASAAFQETVNRYHERKHQENASATDETSAKDQRVFRLDNFYRLDEGRLISGVCSGLGDYFRIDANLIRLGFILLSIPIGFHFIFFVILYVAMAILFPLRDMPAP